MPSIYFATHFASECAVDHWPDEFAVITAFATTGESWSEEQNYRADQALEKELRLHSSWVQRLTGYSPTTGHAEPGWAVQIRFDDACDIGLKYLQDAVYLVSGDTLSVSFCDIRRRRIEVGPFRSRVHCAASFDGEYR